MTTPLIILSILFIPVMMAWIINATTPLRPSINMAGVIALTLAFGFFAIGHFVRSAEMVAMLPSFMPKKLLLVYVTGLAEFAVAAALLIPRTRPLAGWAAAAMLVLFFPVNVYGAINHAPMGGHAWGPVYLLLRAPLQIILIGWTYWFILRHDSKLLRRG
ncbi:hypothetical protein [Ahrensia sp. 13_GOM-1096m]|uniref:DoxX family protein n=1 Tax=Ahrensia sp. 13_GOM-1096m TaxID=1380380 RepID=UPI00047B8EDA|nr:hypothetical protein [Ahrensia sp. 13_GOM-1096m]